MENYCFTISPLYPATFIEVVVFTETSNGELPIRQWYPYVCATVTEKQWI